MRPRLVAASLALLLAAGVARAQEDPEPPSRPVPERVFELAQKLLDDRASGGTGKERKKLLKALDAILEETTFGEGDTARAKLTGKPIKTEVRARALPVVADENPHETSFNGACVLGETVRSTSLSRSVVIARESVAVTGCDHCVVICLGDFQCTSGNDTVVLARGRATATVFQSCVVWAEEKVASNPGLEKDLADLTAKLDAASRGRLDEVQALLARTDPAALGDALRRVRKLRLKASVPLLLLHMQRTQDARAFAACGRAVVLLTGLQAPEPADASDAGRRLAVKKWVEETWNPEKEKLSTDLAQLDRRKLDVVLSELKAVLLEAAQLTRDDLEDGSSAQGAQKVLAHLVDRDAIRGDAVTADDVAPSMAGPLLDRASDESDAWAAARILSLLVQRGESEEIDKAANDPARPLFSRLAAHLAGWIAGNDLATEPLLQLLDKAKRLDERIAVALVLGRTRDPGVQPRFVSQLQDRSAEVRAAALYGLGELRPRSLAPEVKELVTKKGEEWAEYPSLLFAVASVKSDREAQGLIAESLQQAVNASTDRAPNPSVLPRLQAFERATGQKWTRDDYPRAPRGPGGRERPAFVDLHAARSALDWWKQQEKARDK